MRPLFGELIVDMLVEIAPQVKVENRDGWPNQVSIRINRILQLKKMVGLMTGYCAF